MVYSVHRWSWRTNGNSKGFHWADVAIPFGSNFLLRCRFRAANSALVDKRGRDFPARRCRPPRASQVVHFQENGGKNRQIEQLQEEEHMFHLEFPVNSGAFQVLSCREGGEGGVKKPPRSSNSSSLYSWSAPKAKEPPASSKASRASPEVPHLNRPQHLTEHVYIKAQRSCC